MEAEHEGPRDGEDVRRPSWSPLGVLLIELLILALGRVVGVPVSAALLVSFLGVLVWSTFSRSQYEQMRRSYPGYPRGDYVLNGLLQHLLAPLAVLASLVLAARLLGG